MPGKNLKRDNDRFVFNTLKGNIENKYKSKGFIAWGGAAIINSRGEFEGIVSFGPKNTVLNAYVNSQEILDGLKNAAEETFYTMYDPDANEEFDQEVETEHLIKDLLKPPRPIMDLTNIEMQAFFPQFIQSVYDKENLTIVNKWAKLNKNTGETIPPRPPCPNWNNGFINPNFFRGMGRVYKFGNTLWRLKMQVCHILLKYDINPDNHAIEIPTNYVSKNLKLEDLENMGRSKNEPNIAVATSNSRNDLDNINESDIVSPQFNNEMEITRTKKGGIFEENERSDEQKKTFDYVHNKRRKIDLDNENVLGKCPNVSISNKKLEMKIEKLDKGTSKNSNTNIKKYENNILNNEIENILKIEPKLSLFDNFKIKESPEAIQTLLGEVDMKDIQENVVENSKSDFDDASKNFVNEYPDKISDNQENLDSKSYDIIKFFMDISLPELIDIFITEAVTIEMLYEMSGEDLKELGISKFGHRFKIISSVKKMFM